MSLFRLPRKVKVRLEKIQRDFLWGGERKIHLVKWDIVCTSKRKGGLGIRKLSNLNKALLGKCNWRFSMEEEVVWWSIISLKYGMEDGGRFSNSPRGSFGVGLWKDIGKEVIQIRQNCSFKVGNGCKVRFWEDVWCSEALLCSSFPSLYEVASSKGDMVADLWEINGTGGGWNFRFERHVNDWELEEAQRFICTVSTKSLNPSQLIEFGGMGQRMVCSQSSLVMTYMMGGRQHLVLVNMIWNPIVPTKVEFFVWEVWWGKILTMDQLKKCGFSLASKCPFCGQKKEALEHFFIHCAKIWDLWTTLFSLPNGGWVCPYLV